MMLHNNGNMKITVLVINRESIIILLNTLLYPPDSMDLKSRYMSVATELHMDHKKPVHVGTTNTLY